MLRLRPIAPIAPIAIFAAIYGCSTQPSDAPAPVARTVTESSPAAQRASLDGASREALRARRAPAREQARAPVTADTATETRAAKGFAAHHQPEAQLLTEGGPVIAAPHVVPIFYAGDPETSTLVDFTGRLLTSHFWKQTVGEYGVGPGTVAAPVIRNEVAPPTLFDTEIEAWLKATLDAHDPSLPAPDANTIYAMFFPPGTVVEFTPSPGYPAPRSCKSFGAFHYEITLASGQKVAYAVMPRCDQGYRNYTGVEELTLAPAHEIAEIVTDPYPGTGATYDLLDFAGSADYTFEGGEVGDLCEFIPVSVASDTDVGYPVQRIWSNRAAAASHDPCLPALGPAYFNSAPVVGGTEIYSGEYARGITLPPGGTVTVDVELFSDAPTAPWTLSAKEIDSATLTFAFDQAQGRNGDKRHLTITRGLDQNLDVRAEIDSTLDGRTNTWPLLIGY
jgi:hypothetical protein